MKPVDSYPPCQFEWQRLLRAKLFRSSFRLVDGEGDGAGAGPVQPPLLVLVPNESGPSPQESPAPSRTHPSRHGGSSDA